MPVFNSRQYLADTMLSVLSEDSRSFELILVDDGSTDGSGDVCERFRDLDSRVRVLHKDNGGVSSARNAGIRHARGKYVMFCDNDDLALPGIVLENLSVAERLNADCVRFGVAYELMSADGHVENCRLHCPQRLEVFASGEMPAHLPDIDYDIEGVWSGMYRTSIIRDNGLMFDESFRSGYEDALFNLKFIEHSSVYVLNPHVYYVWLQRRSHSTSTTITENMVESVASLLSYERGLMVAYGLADADLAFCGRRIFRRIRSFFTMHHFEGSADFSSELSVYEACYRVLSPYRDLLSGAGLGTAADLILDLLFHQRYRALYALLSLGARAKKIEREARLLRNRPFV